MSLHSLSEDLESLDLFRSLASISWSAFEYDFSCDRIDYERESEELKRLIAKMLAFTIVGDDKIIEETEKLLYKTARSENETYYLNLKQANETHHAISYKLMADMIQYPDTQTLCRETLECDALKKKFEFIEKIREYHNDYSMLRAAFAVAEGIFFTSVFYFFFWLRMGREIDRSRQKEPYSGCVAANNAIRIDEAFHYWAFVKLSGDGVNLSKVESLIRFAVDVELASIDFLLKEDKCGVDIDEMKNYTRCYANNIAEAFGLGKLYDVDPVDLPEWAWKFTDIRTNFYERAPSGYSTPEPFVYDTESCF